MMFVSRGGGAVLPSGKSTTAASSSPASSRRNNSLVSSLTSRSRTLGYFSLSARIGPISVASAKGCGSPMRKRPCGSASLDATDFSVSVRCNRSRACSSTLEPSEFRRGGLTERSSNSAPNAASSLCSCRVIADGVRYRRSAAPTMDPARANSTRARKSSNKGTPPEELSELLRTISRIVPGGQYHGDNYEAAELSVLGHKECL